MTGDENIMPEFDRYIRRSECSGPRSSLASDLDVESDGVLIDRSRPSTPAGRRPLHARAQGADAQSECGVMASNSEGGPAFAPLSTGLAASPGASSPPYSRRRSNTSAGTLLSTSRAMLLAVLALAVPAFTVSAQEEERVCSCSPTIYRFNLNFAQPCPPPGIKIGNETGVDRYFCRVDNNDDESPTASLVPVSLVSYAIFELDAAFQVIKQFFRGGLDLQDGDSFEYTSITASEGVDDAKIPRAIQMAMNGVGNEGEEIVSQWIVTFTNKCDVLPFQDGEYMSWTTFSNLIPPRPELCDVEPEPTPAPTFEPTPQTPPTPAPVEPTPEPTPEVTPEPTPPPVEPTPSPVEPTPEPTPEPTQPAVDPTDPPVEPTPEPTPSPVEPTERPVEPTEPPVEPTPEPTPPPIEPEPIATPKPTKKPSPAPKPKPKPTPKPTPMSMSQGYDWGEWENDLLDPNDVFGKDSRDGGKDEDSEDSSERARRLFKSRRTRGGRRILREGLEELNVHMQ